MSTMFRSEEARDAMIATFEGFRARVPGATSTRRVATRAGETHVLEAGKADGPPLVLFHGALATSAHATAELGPLLDRFHVFAPDVIGQSPMSADARVSLDDASYGEWASEVMAALGLTRAVVYGVSWGGFVARKLAEHAPERIDRLVLLVPAGFVSGPAWKGFTTMGLPLLTFRLFGNARSLERFFENLLSTRDEAWESYLRRALGSYKMDIRVPPLAKPEPLAAFERPTLVFGASDDGSFPGITLLARVKELLPHAETELLEGSKHAPPTDDAFRRRMADRISRFALATPVEDRAAP